MSVLRIFWENPDILAEIILSEGDACLEDIPRTLELTLW
jgi:hypothetical protein